MKYFTHSEGHRINVKCQFFFQLRKPLKNKIERINKKKKKKRLVGISKVTRCYSSHNSVVKERFDSGWVFTDSWEKTRFSTDDIDFRSAKFADRLGNEGWNFNWYEKWQKPPCISEMISSDFFPNDFFLQSYQHFHAMFHRVSMMTSHFTTKKCIFQSKHRWPRSSACSKPWIRSIRCLSVLTCQTILTVR